MESGSIRIDELQQRLRESGEQAWLRAVIARDEDPPSRLLYGCALIGLQPEDWREKTWAYEQCTFVSTEVTADDLADLIQNTEARRDVTLGLERASMRVNGEWVSWRHHPSLARFDRLELPWPWTQYEVSLDEQRAQLPQNFLVSGGNRSFSTSSRAFNAFFFGEPSEDGGNLNISLGRIELRMVDRRARICGVRLGPSRVEVDVDGRELDGLELELSGDDQCQVMPIEQGQGSVSFPLPHGRPEEGWVWLKDTAGHGWRDYRSLASWGGHRSPDVQIEVPRDKVAELTSLTSQGEGQYVEYKRKLPETKDEKYGTFKTVAAFATGEGGTILFGVDRDEGEVLGLTGERGEVRDRIVDLVRANVQPTPKFELDDYMHEGKLVFALRVSSGSGTLYALVLDSNNPKFFVRRQGTTYPARPEELEQIVRGSQPPAATQHFSLLR